MLIFQLLNTLIVPVTVAILGYFINRSVKRLEHSQWANQKLVEKRLEIFEEVAPCLNDLYCFFIFKGHWKELTPPAIVGMKRSIDKAMYVHQYLFNDSLMNEYRTFMNTCFKTHNTPGSDAKLRTLINDNANDREKFVPNWQKEWEILFVIPSEVSPKKDVRDYYQALILAFTIALGIVTQNK